MRNSILGLTGILLLTTTLPIAASDAVDAKLLKMLAANGAITAAQYAELSADLAQEKQQTATTAAPETRAANGIEAKADVAALPQIAWAANTVVSGDVRVRQDNVHIDGVVPNPNQDRQRIRARLAVVSQVSPDVEAGIRVAGTNNDDARSSNLDMDNYFTRKDLWLDRAYIDWHPSQVSGLSLIAGKMAQPWTSVSQVIWDNDVNPEGIATQYSHRFGGIELSGSAGAFTLKNNVTGEGNQFDQDLRLQSAQAAVRFAPAQDYELTLGSSVYHYYNDAYGAAGLALNGNTSTQFQLYEGFSQLDVTNLPFPLSLVGQYGRNAAANGAQADKDSAWLVGLTSRIGQVGVVYNYRDVEANAVVGAFSDSDFAAGFTASRGHQLQLTYNIVDNFALTATYNLAQSNAASPGNPGADTNTWQIDLLATF